MKTQPPVGGPRPFGLTNADRGRVWDLLCEDDLTVVLPYDLTPDDRMNGLHPWSEKARVLQETFRDLRNGGDGTGVSRFTDEQWSGIVQRSDLTGAERNALMDRCVLEEFGLGIFRMLLLQLFPAAPPLPPSQREVSPEGAQR